MLSFFCYLAKYRYFSRLTNQRNTVFVLFAQASLFCYSEIMSLFCYSAWYQYPYFQFKIEMENTGNRLLTVGTQYPARVLVCTL